MVQFKPEKIERPGGEKGPSFKIPRPPGGRFARILGVLVLGVALVLLLVRFCFVYIEPYEYGIKEVQIGLLSSKGIQKDIYEAGYAFRIPGVFERIHRFPRGVQIFEMNSYGQRVASPFMRYDNAAKIQTSDGFYVDVDATILYHIEDPYLVMVELGPGDLYYMQGIHPVIEPTLKDAFGSLTTEDFYNSPKRVERGKVAEEELNAILESKGLKVDHVLIRYFEYSPEIQANIEEKKIQDQMVFKNQSEGRAAMAEAQLKRVRMEGEAALKVELEEGEAYVIEKTADLDLYTRKKKAAADLIVQLAEARKAELRNEALQVKGSDRAVAMKMAEVLEGMETIIVPVGGETGINALDLDALLDLFGVESYVMDSEVSADSARPLAFEDLQKRVEELVQVPEVKTTLSPLLQEAERIKREQASGEAPVATEETINEQE